ncbi:MAG TPA: hypothetical protein VN408_06045 [Actinoplanes sp.]|nr:hypothetical protein [Actinoplanes sp.]
MFQQRERLVRLDVAVGRVPAGPQAAVHRRVQFGDVHGSSQDVGLVGPGHRAGVFQCVAGAAVQRTVGQFRQAILGGETAYVVTDQRGERGTGGVSAE